jgi:hypothetical protein
MVSFMVAKPRSPTAGKGNHATIELSTKVIDVEEQLRSTLLHKMRHAAQWMVSLFCGWSRYSTISGKYLLIIAWAVSLLPLLSGVFTEIRVYNSLSPGMLSTHLLMRFGATFMQT